MKQLGDTCETIGRVICAAGSLADTQAPALIESIRVCIEWRALNCAVRAEL